MKSLNLSLIPYPLSLLFLAIGAQASFSEVSPWAVSLHPQEAFQGGIVEIKVSGGEVLGVKGSVRNREITFFSEGDGSYATLFGIDLEEKAGSVDIIITGREKSAAREVPITLVVKERVFPKEHVTVSATFDRLDQAALKRIKEEQARVARLWGISTPKRLWQGRFIPPVPGGVTSPFGLRRVINGVPRSPHGGVDFKAPLGAEVVAPNHGKVVLRDDFFFSGKSIVLDHGGGLYTMYFHLDDFRVEEGSLVRKGDLLGLVGKTGRVTGPHLHWGVRLNGARVDPLELLERLGGM